MRVRACNLLECAQPVAICYTPVSAQEVPLYCEPMLTSRAPEFEQCANDFGITRSIGSFFDKFAVIFLHVVHAVMLLWILSQTR